MKSALGLIGTGVLAAAVALSGQQPPSSAAPQLPKGQMPALGRPTESADPVPLFDFGQYFLGGKWTFEWLVPESPLGPAGRFSTGETSALSFALMRR